MLILPVVFGALALTVQAAKLSVESARLTVSSPNNSELRAEDFTFGSKPSPITLGEKDSLKLSFKIVDEAGKGVQPHQTFLRFYDPITDEEGIQPVSVSASGKAKFELNVARPFSSLPPTTSTPLDVTLILGSFKHSPAKYDAFSLVLPPSQPGPVDPEADTYHSLPEIHHTFRADPKLPPKFISLAGSAMVLGPWILLLSLWAVVKAPTPHLLSFRILPFTVCLAASEALIVSYWIGLKLGDIILYAGILVIPTIFTGKSALTAISELRQA